MKADRFYSHERWLNLLLGCNIPWIKGRLLNCIYDQDFFMEMVQIKAESARAFAQVISSNLEFHSLLDIGCGMGMFLSEFHKLGKEVVGCEASRQAIALASKDFLVFFADATKPILVNRTYDLVMCIEVAEHVNRRYSLQLVENCTRHAEQVLFTAAPKGQKGIGHINMRPRGYWQDLFKKLEFELDILKTERIKEQLSQRHVLDWLCNNLMIFTHNRTKI